MNGPESECLMRGGREQGTSTLAMSIHQGFTLSHYLYLLFMAEKCALAYREGWRYQEGLNLETEGLNWKQSILPCEDLSR